MRLDRLVRADMYRDGGSLEFEFTTDSGEPYLLSLRANRSIPGEYDTLCEVALADATVDADPSSPWAATAAQAVRTGSIREEKILVALRDWIERCADTEAESRPDDVRLVHRMVEQIPRRRSSPPTWPITSG